MKLPRLVVRLRLPDNNQNTSIKKEPSYTSVFNIENIRKKINNIVSYFICIVLL